jgi:hypothetical protein
MGGAPVPITAGRARLCLHNSYRGPRTSVFRCSHAATQRPWSQPSLSVFRARQDLRPCNALVSAKSFRWRSRLMDMRHYWAETVAFVARLSLASIPSRPPPLSQPYFQLPCGHQPPPHAAKVEKHHDGPFLNMLLSLTKNIQGLLLISAIPLLLYIPYRVLLRASETMGSGGRNRSNSEKSPSPSGIKACSPPPGA